MRKSIGGSKIGRPLEASCLGSMNCPKSVKFSPASSAAIKSQTPTSRVGGWAATKIGLTRRHRESKAPSPRRRRQSLAGVPLGLIFDALGRVSHGFMGRSPSDPFSVTPRPIYAWSRFRRLHIPSSGPFRFLHVFIIHHGDDFTPVRERQKTYRRLFGMIFFARSDAMLIPYLQRLAT